MTARRSMTPARKRRIAQAYNWCTPQGAQLALERGKVVLLATGTPPEFDHIHQLAMGGTDSDDNLRPLTPADHKDKTRADAKARGKVRRLSGQNKPKRKYNWPKRKLPTRAKPWGRA